jgi:hypothetical protein
MIFGAILFSYIAAVLAVRHFNNVYKAAGIVALTIHIIVGVLVLPHVPYQWDISTFHQVSLQLLSGGSLHYSSTVSSFAPFQAFGYVMFGASPTVLSVINGLLAILIPIPLIYLSKSLYPKLETINGLIVVSLFLPMTFFILSLPMRDTLSFFVTISLFALIVFTLLERHLWPVLLIQPLWGCLYLLRPELALLTVIGGISGAFMLFVDSVTIDEPRMSELVAVGLPVAIVGFGLFALEFPISEVTNRVTYRARGGGAYLEGFQYQSWLDIVYSIPVRAIYFQFTPFPLHVNSIFDLLGFVPLPILILLFLGAAISLRRQPVERVAFAVLLPIYLGGIAGYGLIDSNFGTTARHRVPFVLLLTVFAAPVLERCWFTITSWYDFANEPGEDDEHHRKTQELDGGVHR